MTTLLEQASSDLWIWNHSILDYPAKFYNSLHTGSLLEERVVASLGCGIKYTH